MENIIEIDNLSYSKRGNYILDNICLKIKRGEFVSIIGNNGAGKSCLVRILLGLDYADEGSITIFSKSLIENKHDIIKKIGVMFENPDNTFVADKVSDEIIFSLKNMHLPSEEIDSRLKEVTAYLNIEDILACMPHTLSGGQKQLVSLASALIIYPEILIIDGSLDMIDSITKDKILSLLKKIHCEKNITILYVTQDVEDTLYTDRIILLSEGKVCLDDNIKKFFENEKVFQDVGLSVPFMVSLSKKLQYYDLVDKIEFNMDKLVNKLWK